VLTSMVLEAAATSGQASGDTFLQSMPMGRFAEPVEISRLVAYLASDDSSYSTGSEFIADGGALCGPGY
jgi:3alpha(or 20beta)-hydroxysteroid dehydrogenase